MNREEFRKLASEKVLILDGATGSNLIKAGMKSGECPESFMLSNPSVLVNLQSEYVKAGTNILYAPTFSGNRIKLEEYHMEDQIEYINKELVALTKEAADGKALVAGDLTMTGVSLAPVGSMEFEELVNIYKEQISCILEAGVDLFVVETMMSLAECRAAVLAVKESCDLPVMVTLTFAEDGKTLFGTDAATAVNVLQAMGVDAIGANCSTGPDKMCGIISEMNRYAKVPIIAKPNAGLPKLVDGETMYDMAPDEFAKEMKKVIEAGATIVGGCCGTTPEHIKRLNDIVVSLDYKEIIKKVNAQKTLDVHVLTNERRSLVFKSNERFLVIGERINPTGKKELQAALKEGDLSLVSDMAISQEELGANVLDVNVGMNGIDEKDMMVKVVKELSTITNLPLSIDTSHVDIVEAALREYPGRALINSISYDEKKTDVLLGLAKKYGAMFILLPLSEKGLPKNFAQRKELIDLIYNKALNAGLTKEDIIVDGLVNTVGAKKNAGVDTLDTIEYCTNELGLPTTCGLSNISFGLPQRPIVNAAFLTMAIQKGLTIPIMNPSQSLLMNMAMATDMLKNSPDADLRYLEMANEHPFENGAQINSGINKERINEEKKGSATENKKELDAKNSLQVKEKNPYTEVIKGNKNKIIDYVKLELDRGEKPEDIIDNMLIPAINQVGVLFDSQKYYLPQLIASANTMKLAIDYLEPMIERKKGGNGDITIVMATVEGDIHDIGKNLVVLMLKNYGYNVVDLGKDVPAEIIVEEAKKNNAQIIGLSALMTTTMTQMKKVIELKNAQYPQCQVIIGGAVTTQEYADEINAQGYSKDAQEAVGKVKELLERMRKYE
ncbi:MAG: homocysteine S-methyltransferase family protein [Lachnospiraceae bacterium]|nr:homocysteine S-methyltransferase family protein [Lachnospiraceae bacterium]